MKRFLLILLAVSFVAGSLLVVQGTVAMPQAVRIGSGLTTVLFLSGFALLCAISPEHRFGLGEWMLASIGISLAVTTCIATILAAAPIGLSRTTISYVLGGCTIALSLVALGRHVKRHPGSPRSKGHSRALQS